VELTEAETPTEEVTFEAYVTRRSAGMVRMAWLVTRDWDDARDAVQDAFVSLVRRWDRLPGA
jgi:DNA-directed RNA polymerase specialized sigma24 family protein